MDTPPEPAAIDLDATRLRITRKLREVRLTRGWTQAELAARLGLSQSRLSVIERGDGTLSAEQFVAFLVLANLSIEEFLPPPDRDASWQNALARLGALHLRAYEDTLPSERLSTVHTAIREVLLHPESPRLVTACAPILVFNIEVVNLNAIHRDLVPYGRAHRLGWLADNVREALTRDLPKYDGDWAYHCRLARVQLLRFVEHAQGARGREAPRLPDSPDWFDAGIASEETARELMGALSEISRGWAVLSALQPADFWEAIDAAAR